MSRIVVVPLVLTLAANAAVIFSNLPPNLDFSPATIGLGAIPVPGTFVEMGLAFTPAETATLSSLDVPLMAISGTPLASISVWDGAVQPTGLLESFTVTLSPQLQLLNVPSTVHPQLTGGQQYWVVLTAGDPNSWIGWAYGAPAAESGPVAYKSHPGDPWNVYFGNRGTLQVNGDLAVPEPSTLTLLCIGFVALRLTRKTRPR